MTILDGYLFRRVWAAFLKTCFSLVLLFIVFDVLTHRRGAILEHDIPAFVVIGYYLWLIPKMLNDFQLAPLSLLISGLLVFGSFVQRNEYMAMLAGGIGLRRMMLAPMAVALIATIGLYAMNELIGPTAAKRTIEMERTHFGSTKSRLEREGAGVFWPELENGWKCDVRSFNRVTFRGEGVFLYAIQNDRHEQIEAERIFWDAGRGVWMLEEGSWTVYDPGDGMTGRTRRILKTEAPFGDLPEHLLTSEVDTQTQSMAELSGLIEKHKNRSRTARRMRLDLHTKIVDPLVCILFMGLALPFSIRLGRGGLSVGLSIAVFVGLGYLVISGISHSMGYSGRLSPMTAAWLPFTVYFIGCSALILRTPT